MIVLVTNKPNMKSKLISDYIAFTLEHNEAPKSVYLFAKHIGITEKEFYDYFSSTASIEMEIYREIFDTTFDACASSEVWGSYSAREKALSVFYAFIESLKANRSFFNYLHDRDFKKLPKWPAYLTTLHESFQSKFGDIISSGMDTQEISSRKFIDEKYVDGLWLNLLFVLKFWIEDHSERFEKTDAAIEKSVNLAFDLMSKSAIDTALDFTKFLFQRS